MYLHIYKDCVINNKDVIGIFNINNIKESKVNIEFLEELNKNNDIKNISENQEKILILTNKSNKTSGYISNLAELRELIILTLGKGDGKFVDFFFKTLSSLFNSISRNNTANTPVINICSGNSFFIVFFFNIFYSIFSF